MNWLIFFFGLIMGSFYNVIIWRIPKKESILQPGSHCPECNEKLTFVELIPILSFILQRGTCRNCRAKISLWYPIVELLTAIGFYALSYYAVSWQDLIVKLVFYSLLIISGVIDIRTRILPNVITIPGMVIGLLFAALGWSISFKNSLGGIFVGGGILLLISLLSKGGMGMGDVKFMALIGSFIGPVAAVVALFLASFFGALLGSIYLFITKKDRKTPIPFGPFLMLGAFTSYWYLFLL